MSKLTFGIEMELFIKLDKNLYTLIYNEIIVILFKNYSIIFINKLKE